MYQKLLGLGDKIPHSKGREGKRGAAERTAQKNLGIVKPASQRHHATFCRRIRCIADDDL